MPKDDRKARILERAEREKVKFMRLQFTDILGSSRTSRCPTASSTKRSTAGSCSTARRSRGSSASKSRTCTSSRTSLRSRCSRGRTRGAERVGRIICDIANPDGTRSPDAHGQTLKRAIALAAEQAASRCRRDRRRSSSCSSGARRRADDRDARLRRLLRPDAGRPWRGRPPRDHPRARADGISCRGRASRGGARASTRSTSATTTRSTTADNVSTFRFVVKNVANRNGLHATFMPKPIFGINGSGMHTHQSLFARQQNAVLRCERGQWQLSRTCLHYIGGLLRHAKALLRDHQPARELVQAARARLRGADRHRLVGTQSQPAHSRTRRARRADAHRTAHAGSFVQSVPRVRRDAARGPGRHRQADSTRVRRSTRTSTR